MFGAIFCCYIWLQDWNQTYFDWQFWRLGSSREKSYRWWQPLITTPSEKEKAKPVYMDAKQERWPCFIITHNHHTWSSPMKGVKPSWCSNNLLKVTSTIVSIVHVEICRKANCIQILVPSMSQLNDNATYINWGHLCISGKQCFKEVYRRCYRALSHINVVRSWQGDGVRETRVCSLQTLATSSKSVSSLQRPDHFQLGLEHGNFTKDYKD